MKGQVNTADEAKLLSPIHSTFGAFIMRHVIGHCHEEESGPFCLPTLAAGMAVFSASHQFAEHTSKM